MEKITSELRVRMSAKDAHYGGNLVGGAHMLHRPEEDLPLRAGLQIVHRLAERLSEADAPLIRFQTNRPAGRLDQQQLRWLELRRVRSLRREQPERRDRRQQRQPDPDPFHTIPHF